jgi:hypothetical protein
MWTRWCEAESGVKQQAADRRHRQRKGVFGPRFLNCHLGATGKEQVNPSHLQLVVEQRCVVAAKLYLGVDQIVIIHSLLLDGVGCDGAIAQSQI